MTSAENVAKDSYNSRKTSQKQIKIMEKRRKCCSELKCGKKVYRSMEKCAEKVYTNRGKCDEKV